VDTKKEEELPLIVVRNYKVSLPKSNLSEGSESVQSSLQTIFQLDLTFLK